MRGAILPAGIGTNRDMHDRHGADAPPEVAARPESQVGNGSGETVRKQVVLVADDSELVRRIGEAVLSADGFRVVLAIDGESTLAAAERERPDVVVLDLLMPNGTGFDVLREMKKSDSLKDLPVLVMSGVYKENVVGFLAQLGAEGFIDKEHLSETLAFRVRAVLRDRAELEASAGEAEAEGEQAAQGDSVTPVGGRRREARARAAAALRGNDRCRTSR